jgi:hypothetical protein
MKTIQMTMDEPLLDEVDQVIQDLKTTLLGFYSHSPAACSQAACHLKT